jgi:hypothetical protein
LIFVHSGCNYPIVSVFIYALLAPNKARLTGNKHFGGRLARKGGAKKWHSDCNLPLAEFL